MWLLDSMEDHFGTDFTAALFYLIKNSKPYLKIVIEIFAILNKDLLFLIDDPFSA